MSTEETKKHWVALAPSILTGLAALVAALTTVYINVRNDNKSAPTAVTHVAPTAVLSSVAITPSKPLPVQAKIINVQLERIRVDNDGSMGTTDWTFDIQNGERSLFSVPFKALVDDAGENIVTPKDAALARANVTIAPENTADIIVRGWKQAWSGKSKAPDVIGKAKLNSDDDSLVIEVKSEKAGGAAFVLYFNTRIAQK